ncbi:transposase [Oceaniferula marina]|uniref:transposase n=1 Tax=Oceaniferula marina TaxID=2748318 RepID=UPI0031BB2832
MWADGGYTGKLIDEVAKIQRLRKVKLEIVKRSDDIKGFKLLPRRWVVERTFGWLIQSRRLVRGYETRIDHLEAMVHISMSKRMLARIAS